jgi:uroporphyrinogen III methyltransferase / synthase
MNRGRVYLVGAGPGDPGLCTLRGRELIGEADVIVHDDFVDRRLLRFARAGAEIVTFGKRGDALCCDLQQQEVNQRMIREARAGRVVVRLKSGDPFVFGRGSEEAQALSAAGIPYEVVPGVTSAVAVPAYAGIPVTARGLNSSFAIITGHEATGTSHRVDWDALARAETIVVLMGLKELRGVLARLGSAGKAGDTPAACIRGGTGPDQRTVVGSVADLADRVERAGFEPPAVVVVGEVVRLRDSLSWYERRPLLGRRIVITRAAGQALGLAERIERMGAEAIIAPTIELGEPRSYEALDRALARADAYDWVVFTSSHGVEVFFARLAARGGDVRQLWRARLAAIGPGTAAALSRRGLRAEIVPAEFRAEALACALTPHVRGRRVLLPRAEGARSVLPRSLVEAGAEVTDVGTYRAEPPAGLPGRLLRLLEERAIDAVTFTSSSTVRHFEALLGPDAADKLGAASVACIGPITAKTARDLGFRVAIEAREYTIDGLTTALVDYFTAGR